MQTLIHHVKGISEPMDTDFDPGNSSLEADESDGWETSE